MHEQKNSDTEKKNHKYRNHHNTKYAYLIYQNIHMFSTYVFEASLKNLSMIRSCLSTYYGAQIKKSVRNHIRHYLMHFIPKATYQSYSNIKKHIFSRIHTYFSSFLPIAMTRDEMICTFLKERCIRLMMKSLTV